MSDPLTDRLARFTPAGLDRDALLFSAGRASARPDRRWQAIAGLLAVAQVLTLAWLFRPVPAPAPHTAAPAKAPADFLPSPRPAGGSEDPPSLIRRWPRADEPAPAVTADLVPDAPPLRAFPASAAGPVN
jgi:hypothetical protein